MEYIQITKKDLHKGDLVKTYKDSYLVDFKNDEKILRSTSDPSKIMSLLNYTNDLIDIRRFRQKSEFRLASLEDIIAIRKHDSEEDSWNYTREEEPFLNNGFKVKN